MSLFEAFQRGTGAIDWCEANYTVTPLIAELWNTLSSLAFLPVAVVVWRMARQVPHGAVMRQSAVVLALIGLGSAWFHGTLSRAGQLVDEVSISWLLLVGLGHVASWPLWRTAIIAAVSTALMAIYPALNPIFLLTIGTFLLLRALVCASGAPRSLRVGIATMALAVCAWVADRVCFQQAVSLHAFWHVIAALAGIAVMHWLGHTPPQQGSIFSLRRGPEG